MTEKKGHFEKGCWVEESGQIVTEKNEIQIDSRISEATKSVISAMDDAAKVTRDLITTEEGKQFIEKTMKDTRTQIQKTFDEIVSRAKEGLDKNVKSLK